MAATNDDYLARLFRNDTNLNTLDLNWNAVKDEGTGRLAVALVTNSTLTTLRLINNQVGDEGAARLAEALTTNSTLSILNLGYNGVRDEGAGRLAEALATNSTLTTLDLRFNQVNTRHPFDAHLDRNKNNQEKRSASLFLMLLPSLSLDDDEPS